MASTPAAYDQDSYRFRNDDGSDAAATYKAAVNTDVSITLDENFRLRFLVQETAGGDTGNGFKIQYNHIEGTNVWTDVTAASDAARMAASTGLTEGADTTQQIGAGSFLADNNGQEDGDGTTPDTGNQASQEWELEFCLQLRSATVSAGDTVQFRVVEGGGAAFATYTNTPTATAALADPVYDQDSFQGFNEGTEAASTAIAAANTDWSQRADETFFIRFLVQCTVNGEAGFKPTVYWRKKPVGGAYGAWGLLNSSLAGEAVSRVGSASLTHGADTTQRLGAGSFTANNQGVIEDGAYLTLTTVAGEEWEVLVSTVIDRLQNDPGDAFEFKVTNNGTDLDTYTNTPEVTVAATPPPFSDHPSGLHGSKKLLLHVGG